MRLANPFIRCEAWEINEHAPKVNRRAEVEPDTYLPPQSWDPQRAGKGHQRTGISIELVRVGLGVEEVTMRFKSQGDAAAFLGTSNAQVSLRKRSGKPIRGENDGYDYIVRQV